MSDDRWDVVLQLLDSLGFPRRSGCLVAAIISEVHSEEKRLDMAKRIPTRERIVQGIRENVPSLDPEQFADDFFLVLPEWPTVTQIRKPEEDRNV